MARIEPTPRSALSPDQLMVNDRILAVRAGGLAGGPFAVLLSDPRMTERIAALYEYLRHQISLPKPLAEIAILTVARAWTCQYEWSGHKKQALAAGIDPVAVAAIEAGKVPRFSEEREAIVHSVAAELQRARAISDATYGKARDLLGEGQLVELVALIGFYTMLAVVLVAFDVDIIPGTTPLEPLPTSPVVP